MSERTPKRPRSLRPLIVAVVVVAMLAVYVFRAKSAKSECGTTPIARCAATPGCKVHEERGCPSGSGHANCMSIGFMACVPLDFKGF